MKKIYLFVFVLIFFLGCGESSGGSGNKSDINPNGYRLIKLVNSRGYTYKYSYNSYGQVIKRIKYNYKNEEISQSTYAYNSTNKIINRITFTPNTHYEYEYSYNNNGQVLSVTKNDKVINTYEYTYNNGKMIQRIHNNKDKYIYTYDNGNMTTSKKYTDNKYISKNIITYDDSNKIIKNTSYDDKNNINYTREYTHNKNKVISRESKEYKLSYYYEDSPCTSFLSHNNTFSIFHVFNKSKCKNKS